jgi:hypothetical protein
MWLPQARRPLMIPMFPMGGPTTAAPASIGAATMETGATRIEAEHIGMTVRGGPVVHEAVPHTGMTAPEVQPAGAEVPPPGIMARVISADIAGAPRIGGAAPAVRLDGVAAPHRGAADRVPFTARVVAPVRGGVERASASKRENASSKHRLGFRLREDSLAIVAWHAAF